MSDYIEKGELAEIKTLDNDISMNSYYLCSKDRWVNPAMKEFIRILTL